MTTALQHRRGTTAQHATFTGAQGEITIDTTKNTAVIHDGSTAGGFPLAKETVVNGAVLFASTQSLTTPQKAQARSNIGAAPVPSGNGIPVQTAADTLTARSIAAGTGISVTNGDGVAGNPTITNGGVTSFGGATGAVTAGSGLSMAGNTLNCTVTAPVSSVGGNTGAITNAQLYASVMANVAPTAGTKYVEITAWFGQSSATTNSSSYLEALNCVCLTAGTYRFRMKVSTDTATAYFRIYKNGVAAGAERTTTSTSPTYATTDDITVAAGDTIQVFAHTNGTANALLTSLEIGAAAWPAFLPFTPTNLGQR